MEANIFQVKRYEIIFVSNQKDYGCSQHQASRSKQFAFILNISALLSDPFPPEYSRDHVCLPSLINSCLSRCFDRNSYREIQKGNQFVSDVQWSWQVLVKTRLSEGLTATQVGVMTGILQRITKVMRCRAAAKLSSVLSRPLPRR